MHTRGNAIALVAFVATFVWACGDDPPTCVDDDGDGYGAGAACLGPDCDDHDATVHPGAFDFLVDGIDQDCDGGDVCLVDADGDGFSASATATVASSDLDCDDFGEATFAMPTNDCDDGDAETFPFAPERFGDGVDQSCDGEEVCFLDRDGDGARGTGTVVSADPDCDDVGEMPASSPVDCADEPAADPACGGLPGARCSPSIQVDGCGAVNVDEDCDGTVDEDGDVLFRDSDGDGLGTDDEVTHACAAVSGFVSALGDCDDRDATVWQDAVYFPDLDADGLGAGDEVPVCEGAVIPLGYAQLAGDCAPLDASAHPQAAEIPGDGVDQDCAGGDLVASDANGIFVATAAIGGDDGNPGTAASPVATLAHALELATSTGRDHVYLTAGEFAVAGVVGALAQSLHGGYDAAFAVRDGGTTTLVGASGLLVGTEPIAIDGLTILVQSDSSDAIGIVVVEGSLTVRDVEVDADGAGNSTGIRATMSRLFVDRSRFTTGRAIASDGILVRGGVTVVTRSRFVVHSATSSGSSTSGVSAYSGGPGTNDAPASVALVGNTFDVGLEGGESLVDGVLLYGIRTRALVANNAFHLGPADTPWTEGAIALHVWASGLPVSVDVVNNLVVATDGPDTAAGVYTVSDGASARVSVWNNDFHVTGAGDCGVSTAGACRDAAAIAACEFDECIASGGNLAADPAANSDLSIPSTSVCVDAGRSPPYASALFATDLAGVARPDGAAIDIGAFEFEH